MGGGAVSKCVFQKPALDMLSACAGVILQLLTLLILLFTNRRIPTMLHVTCPDARIEHFVIPNFQLPTVFVR